MKQLFKSITKLIGIDLSNRAERHHESPLLITKEEILRVFFRELPEQIPKR